jgi:hypothetical protein
LTGRNINFRNALIVLSNVVAWWYI